MTVDIGQTTASNLFSGDSEMSLRLRQVDWCKTVFGPVSQWSQSLKTIVKICIDANLPMAVWWGVSAAAPAETRSQLDPIFFSSEMICNDAYWLDLGIAAFSPESALPQISSYQTEIEPAIKSVFKTGRTAHAEHQTVTSDGEVRFFLLSYSPLLSESGRVNGVFSAGIETTAQKRVKTIQDQIQAKALQCEVAIEKTIKQSTEKAQLQIRNVLESINDAFVAIDKNWCYTYVNQKAAQLLHQESKSLVGQPVWQDTFLGSVGTLTYQELHRAMTDNVPVVFEDHSSSLDAWFEVHGHPCEEGLAVYFQDVSDRKKAEATKAQRLAEAQAAREAAEAASRLKDEFLAVVSHELRSPLNPILGCAKLLRTGELTPERREQALKSIERNAQLQAQLVNDLLDVSRILRDEITLNICAVPVRAAIQTAINNLSLEALSKDILIETCFSSQVGSVLADPSRFQQMMGNLLSNAIKFTPRSGKIVVHADQINNQVKIAIADTGKGINSAFLPHVFDRFRQEDATITRQFGGLGLGLSIVHHLIELHGGAVAASSPGENKGSTFTVFLPAGSSSAKATDGNGKQKQAPNQSSNDVAPVQSRP